MKLSLNIIVSVIFHLSALVASNDSPSCVLQIWEEESVYQRGDLMIGGILQRTKYTNKRYPPSFRSFETLWQCTESSNYIVAHYVAFAYAIEEINRNTEILPNHTLGYQTFNSCFNEMKSLKSMFTILSRQREVIPNYKCLQKGKLVGIVGDLSSQTTHPIAELAGIYKFPQVSYGALDPKFSDKLRYPSFYRTVPNELTYFAGITHLLSHFGWTWVGVVVSENDGGEQGLKEIRKAVAQSGGCVEFAYKLTTKDQHFSELEYSMFAETVESSTAQVYILYSSTPDIEYSLDFVHLMKLPHKIWIMSPIMNFQTSAIRAFNGSLLFSIKKGKMPKFTDFLCCFSLSKVLNDTEYKGKIMQPKLDCDNPGTSRHNPGTWRPGTCSADKTFESSDGFEFDISGNSFAFSVYTAVYAMAHALHAMLSADPRPWDGVAERGIYEEDAPWKLNGFLKKTNFETLDGDEISFDSNGELTPKYHILNILDYFDINHIVYYVSSKKVIEVGSFNPSAPAGHQFFVNDSAITWLSEGNTITQIPRSVCSETCLPGYRKVPIEGKPLCCYSCAPCPEGEFSNSTDMEICKPCPDVQWPNVRKDGCVQKTTDYLSYSDSLGASLASLSVVLSIATAAVLVVFIQLRDTPIVKANNRDLSYALLVSLICAFLCSLLFIGRPVTWTCLTQQAAFGIIFTVAVSCVLAKTITVVIAFNATKPGSRVSGMLGAKMAGSMVLLWTLGEVVICMVWLLTSPPHPHDDTWSETGKIILLCDPGLVSFFYLVISYMGLLAFASFTVAFLARNLPGRFNEAQHITFSMLVFCSVWISFIPAYLSSKGRYMVAVEIFAILASSAGLLFCIFIPKCYIILFRPDLNIRKQKTMK